MGVGFNALMVLVSAFCDVGGGGINHQLSHSEVGADHTDRLTTDTLILCDKDADALTWSIL